MTSPALPAWGWSRLAIGILALGVIAQGQISITANWQHPVLGEQNLGNKIPPGLSAYEVRACNDGPALENVSERWIVAQVGEKLAVQDGEWIEQSIALYRAKGFWPTAGRVTKRVGPVALAAGAGVVTMNPLVGLATKEGIDYLADIGKDRGKVIPPSHWWRDSGSANQPIPPRDCGRPLIVAVADDGKEKVIRIPPPLISSAAIKDSGENLNSGICWVQRVYPNGTVECGSTPLDISCPPGDECGGAVVKCCLTTERTHPMLDEDLEREIAEDNAYAERKAAWVRERSAARGAEQ